uniref:alpha-(1,3)-fucosyltransferase 6 n=1 Tax=Ciona intestinalis TaxID=7719 RepID=UPI000180C338|nr:alpha-(1,3)-fucosyltransferase 6 [Ciona intestinalis]XP_026690257.1 alpha-(1,3)-fucosyltransferase 6 [Ciona intestinalis]|eukprot:XP_018667425.1 alpha-(1,3)-fucosyltransferase 6 [Ciona intestinalis]
MVHLPACFNKVLNFVIRWFDVWFMIYLFVYLANYRIYFSSIKHYPDNKTPWWKWPQYNDWSIDGRMPNYEENVQATKDDRLYPMETTALSNKEKLKEIVDQKVLEKKFILLDDPAIQAFIGGNESGMFLDTEKCGNCEVNYNTSRRSEAAAVVYHFSGMRKKQPMRPRSSTNQLYVWTNQESPQTMYNNDIGHLKYFDKEFNMTMTYRRDSDVYFPYSTLWEVNQAIQKNQQLKNVDLLLASKTKLIAWAAGNCMYTKGAGFRLQMMLQLLEAGLPVEIFGGCLGHRLPGGWTDLPEVLSEYKFYFSLENSYHCRDYMTEKIWWNALRSGVVPVIWGPLRSDVETLLPVGSFIFVEDYSSPKALVKHILYLERHTSEYIKYFQWRNQPPPTLKRKRGDILNYDVTGFCQLCYMLHHDDAVEKETGRRPTRIVNSLFDWWFLEETKECLAPRRFSEIVHAIVTKMLIHKEYYYKFLTYQRFYTVLFVLLLFVLGWRRYKKFKRSSPNQHVVSRDFKRTV